MFKYQKKKLSVDSETVKMIMCVRECDVFKSVFIAK